MNSHITEIRIVGAALIMLEPLTASTDAEVSAAAREAHAALAGLMSTVERRRAAKIDALEKAQKAQSSDKNAKSVEVLRIIADDPSVRVSWSRSETRTGKYVTKVTFEAGAGTTTEFVYDFTPWAERPGETTLTGKLAASCLYVNRKGYLALSKTAKQTILGQMDLHDDDDDDDYNHNIDF